jgi:hypothetical protein
VADDIVERLLDCGCIVFGGVYVAESRHDCLRHRAADLIEAQQAEIERLEFEARKNTAEIERLQRVVKDRDEWNDHLSQTVSFLLLAVPRPFRMAVNRKAVRLLEEEARRG